jgi:hypothetical protein
MKFNLIEGESYESKYDRFVELYNSKTPWSEIYQEFTKSMAQKIYTDAKQNRHLRIRS